MHPYVNKEQITRPTQKSRTGYERKSSFTKGKGLKLRTCLRTQRYEWKKLKVKDQIETT